MWLILNGWDYANGKIWVNCRTLSIGCLFRRGALWFVYLLHTKPPCPWFWNKETACTGNWQRVACGWGIRCHGKHVLFYRNKNKGGDQQGCQTLPFMVEWDNWRLELLTHKVFFA